MIIIDKLGQAEINVKEIIAGCEDCWTITYETGTLGIDDSGEILIARRDVCDSAIPQFVDPVKPGFVKIYTGKNNEDKLKVNYIPDRNIRPWKSCISIKIGDDYFEKGDKLFIQFGAMPGHGRGFRIQSFAEREHIFKILVDCTGSGKFFPLTESPSIKITGGYINRLQAVAPSIVTCGQYFSLLVRALDSWGNIAQKHHGTIDVIIEGEKKEVVLKEGLGSVDGLKLNKEGEHLLTLRDPVSGINGKSNPIKCTVQNSSRKNLYWGDLHGQTKETVGTGSLDDYFSFARDKAAMDFSSWQGNDFQITDELWHKVNKKVSEYHEPGKFITFLGYEWSGNTPAGGDYNIYYLNEDQQIYRSSHWLIGHEYAASTDRNPISELWQEFKGKTEIMAVPHVGGRYGNLDYYDPEFVHLLEIHSHHGTFEWFFREALERGYKVGVVAGSDDHSCRPGLSYPTRTTSRGFVSFDVKGGYTGIYADNLCREDLWNALKDRHCYATSGERIYLEVRCGGNIMGDEFNVQDSPKFLVEVMGSDIIEEVEINRGLERIYSYSETLPVSEDRIKIEFSGVRVRGRNKKTKWDGNISVRRGRIKNYTIHAFNQPDEGAVKISDQILQFHSSTSGDVDCIEIDLDYDETTEIIFSSGPVNFSISIKEIEQGPVTKQAGGIDQYVKIGFSPVTSSKNAEIRFVDHEIKSGMNPYWVKVKQRDGHMAWSSPMYIDKI